KSARFAATLARPCGTLVPEARPGWPRRVGRCVCFPAPGSTLGRKSRVRTEQKDRVSLSLSLSTTCRRGALMAIAVGACLATPVLGQVEPDLGHRWRFSVGGGSSDQDSANGVTILRVGDDPNPPGQL